MKQSKNGTPSYARLHAGELTLPQQNAVDLLAGGKNDTETAAALSLSRVTVTRWRLYDPDFQAALNDRRQEIWGAGCDRLRGLIVQALDVVASTLANPDSPNRLKAAIEVLRMSKPECLTPSGPTDPEVIVRYRVSSIRSNTPGPLDGLLDDGKGLPEYDEHFNLVRAELKAMAGNG
jgi:hypothetical protein